MKTLTINDAIFSTLRTDPSVNPVALQRFVAIANSNPVWNAVLSQAASGEAGPVKFRLATSAELDRLKAEAFFAYDADEIRDTKGFMSVALTSAWFVGPRAQLLAVNAARTGIPATVTHELDHYLRVASFRAIDDLADPSKTFPNLSAEQRFEAYATGRMQVEVMGWYASMKAQQFARTGSINGSFSAVDLMALGDVERELYKIEQRGRSAGLVADSLEAYIAENGAPMLSKNQGGYWDSYVSTYEASMRSGVNFEAVRLRVAYKVESPDDVMNWQESGGNGEPLQALITYRNGNEFTVVKNPDGTATQTVRDRSGVLISRATVRQIGIATQVDVFDGSDRRTSSTLTQTDDDGNVLTMSTNADGSGSLVARSPDGMVISQFDLRRLDDTGNGEIDGTTGTLTGAVEGFAAVFAADFGFEANVGVKVDVRKIDSINNQPLTTALDPQDLQAYGFTWQNLSSGELPPTATALITALDPAAQAANGWAPPQLTVTPLDNGLTERRLTLGNGVELASVRDDDRRVLRVILQRDDTDSTGAARRSITTENRNGDGSDGHSVTGREGTSSRHDAGGQSTCARWQRRGRSRRYSAFHSKQRPFDDGYGARRR